jgi:hypothetical protein
MHALGVPADVELTDIDPALSLATAKLGARVPTHVTDLDPLFPKQQPPKAA